MSNGSHLPILSDGASIRVTRDVRLNLACPKCLVHLDVTDVAFGAIIKCPKCKNITWRPDIQPRWYFRLRNFLIAIVTSFVVGVAGSYYASHLWEANHKSGPPPAPNPQPTTK